LGTVRPRGRARKASPRPARGGSGPPLPIGSVRIAPAASGAGTGAGPRSEFPDRAGRNAPRSWGTHRRAGAGRLGARMEHGLRAAVAESPANSMTHAVVTRRQLSCRLAVAALLVAYALVLLHHTSFSAGGSDSSGYVNGARLLAEGRAREPIRGLARLGLSSDFAPVFTPLGYTAARQPGTMAPSYPPGLPLHMALASLLAGWNSGPFLVSPIAGLACLALLYLLGRELQLPPLLALAGCALLAFAPTFVFQTLQPMSDALATAWALAAVLAAYR